VKLITGCLPSFLYIVLFQAVMVKSWVMNKLSMTSIQLQYSVLFLSIAKYYDAIQAVKHKSICFCRLNSAHK